MLDINKLKELSPQIKERALTEILGNASEALYDFANSKVLEYCFHNSKSGIKADVSPKVLNDWIKKGIIIVSDKDKGKIKRFDILESIWLQLVVDLRKFGLPLDKIKYIREQLDFNVKNFTYLKFNVLNAILGDDCYMLINETGQISFLPVETYDDLGRRGRFSIHITIRFVDYIKKVFLNNAFNTGFEYLEDYNNLDKIKLRFFLKTNFFQEIRINVTKGDTRLITDSIDLKGNDTIEKILSDWKFSKITIAIDNDSEIDIVNSLGSDD